MTYTVYCNLVAYKPGEYTLLVFKDLDTTDYLMCTYLPNWCAPLPSLNEPGFLEFETVIAGEDDWFDKTNAERKLYKYSDNYFKKFVPLQNEQDDNITVKLI